jgi:asparagine N-glycosylation enzyme membrane subunit Stt3
MQSLESIPTWFADYLDISLEAGQAILSIVVVSIVLLPYFYLSRGKDSNNLIPTAIFFLLSAFLVGIGWLPFWLLVFEITVVCLGVAVFGRKIVGG